MSCDHQHDLFQTHFQCPEQNPSTSTRDSLPSPAQPWEPLLSFLLFHIFHLNGIRQDLSFCVWLLSLSTMSPGFIHVTAYIRP